MRQLSPLDSQFLQIESQTTVGHIASLIVLDPSTVPDGRWDLERVRNMLAGRIHIAPVFRQRLVQVPFGLTRPFWADDPHFDLDHHLHEVVVPSPGTREQLGEVVGLLHAQPLDRSRPLWEAWVITGLEDGGVALYSKVHHSAVDGVSGAEVLAALLHLTVEPREVEPESSPFRPHRLPSTTDLVTRGVAAAWALPRQLVRTVPGAVRYVDQLPGMHTLGAARVLSQSADRVQQLFGATPRDVVARDVKAPPTPLNRPISAQRNFAFASLPLSDIRRVRRRFGGTTNDIVMGLCTTALRRWLVDHDALPAEPLVAAVPVSTRVRGRKGEGNEIAVMMAELPTDVPDATTRMKIMREAMYTAKASFDALPAGLLADLAILVPTALNGSAARTLFRLATIPGAPFNLMISNVPGPPRQLYVAGARVVGLHPVSVITDLTGALNITLISTNGSLDFGLIASPEHVPDVWRLTEYLREALDELLALAEEEEETTAAP
jgi:WS/DGAT/MGAT family acyltransferase